jgi:hypothetical protein
MKINLPSDERMKELIQTDVFEPIIKLLIDNNFEPNCKFFKEKIKDKLDFFIYTSHNELRDNSTYVCFDSLKSMYSDNVIPENVFWVTCLNANTDDIYIPAHPFIQDLRKIVEQIKSNNFELTHEWYFDHEGNTGVFLHFIKLVNDTNHFVSIFVTFKNFDGEPTLTEVKNSNK